MEHNVGFPNLDSMIELDKDDSHIYLTCSIKFENGASLLTHSIVMEQSSPITKVNSGQLTRSRTRGGPLLLVEYISLHMSAIPLAYDWGRYRGLGNLFAKEMFGNPIT